MSASESSKPIVPILLYHRVVAELDPADPFAVDADAFTEHLALVAACGRTAMTVSDYVTARRTGDPHADRAVLVTFDDGCRDFVELALPVLRRLGLPSTMYVVAGLVGATSRWTTPAVPLMDWPELRELAADPARVELGAHSMTHPQLDLLPSAAARHQVVESKRVLEDGLQQPVLSFAYPFGHHHRRTRAAVVEAGFASACAVKNRLSPADDDPFALARVTIMAGDPVDRVRAVIEGRGVPVAGPEERLATKGYRWYRRLRSIGRTGA